MNKIFKIKLLTILFSIILTNTFSQSITTEIAQYCDYDTTLDLWKDCTMDYNHTSLFVINEQETMITHTTIDNKSTYYITNKTVELNEKKEKIWMYTVNSDLGKQYIIKINPIARTILCVYSVDNEIKGTTFTIKSIF